MPSPRPVPAESGVVEEAFRPCGEAIRVFEARAMRPLVVTICALALASSVVACSGDSEDGAVSGSERVELEDRAIELAKSFWEAWPDDAIIDRFAGDITFYDPSDGDFTIEGKDRFAPIERNLLTFWAAADPSVERVWVATDGASYRVSYPAVVWPPWLPEPSEHPPVVILYVFGFEDESITKYEVWFEDATLEMLEFGCFGVDACPEAVAIVDRYTQAWNSGEPDMIASLYADDATFTDSVSGIEAIGAGEISGLSDRRFGPGAKPEIEVVGVYAQTNDYQLPAEATDLGQVIALGIQYRVRVPDSDAPPLQGLATFELGTRRSGGFDRHPEGLITREEVFQLVGTYVSAECQRDMEAAAAVPGLEEDLFEHNQELHPTFTSCTSPEEWENAAIAADLGDLLDLGFIEGECGFNPGVEGTPLCVASSAGTD